MGRWVLDDASEAEQGPTKMNSVQNGLLLRVDVHILWDDYLLGVNVDNDKAIVCFGPQTGFDGRKFYINPSTPLEHRPLSELLRRHFEQCVLANLKGTGVRDDFWDDEDVHDLSEPGWQVSLGGHSRLELELATRLGSHDRIGESGR
ncbi:hypothetical protein BDV98DRAFT_99421 [Pterulicium gracile]|uniref:HNH nuclease domain-containing protein n=1 Tax=Pterulicium gracile TaxID=1884261 RepID=A0A5C3QIF2_9AGAR|nr:hypothetical protein BDV98DRAFT_99421 [Pterula gracilis]